MLPAGDGSMGTELENFDYLNGLAGSNQKFRLLRRRGLAR